ncbi:hypothetical protein LIHA111178_12320 [Litorimonas haliclonae]
MTFGALNWLDVDLEIGRPLYRSALFETCALYVPRHRLDFATNLTG